MDKQAAAERNRRKTVLEGEWVSEWVWIHAHLHFLIMYNNANYITSKNEYIHPAEGSKKSAELQSEGEKIKMTNESEGVCLP